MITRKIATAIAAGCTIVIEQFIDFARLGSDEAECLCDINELVSNVAATSSYSHMRLELGTLAPYACRPVAMRRAISNLVENALRYGPAKADAESAIIVRTGIDANAISAMDNGPGILPADMERIRHPFIRLDEARRKQAGCSKSPLNGDATAKSTTAIFTPAD